MPLSSVAVNLTVCDREDSRRLLLPSHRSDRSATQTQSELQCSTGNFVLSLADCFIWYARFSEADFILNNVRTFFFFKLCSNSGFIDQQSCLIPPSLREIESATYIPRSTIQEIPSRSGFRIARPGVILRSLTKKVRRMRIDVYKVFRP